MAADFGIKVTGDLKVALRFEKFPEAVRSELEKPIRAITARLASKIRQAVPKGPTNSLSGLVVEQFFNDPDQVSGRVTFSDQFGKVGALEWGAPGARNRNLVKEHKAKLDHFWAHKLREPTTVIVAAHRRTLNVAEHKFLRGPLQEEAPDAQEQIRAVVEKEAGKDE